LLRSLTERCDVDGTYDDRCASLFAKHARISARPSAPYAFSSFFRLLDASHIRCSRCLYVTPPEEMMIDAASEASMSERRPQQSDEALMPRYYAPAEERCRFTRPRPRVIFAAFFSSVCLIARKRASLRCHPDVFC
jgi:hypothetical protein